MYAAEGLRILYEYIQWFDETRPAQILPQALSDDDPSQAWGCCGIQCLLWSCIQLTSFLEDIPLKLLGILNLWRLYFYCHVKQLFATILGNLMSFIGSELLRMKSLNMFCFGGGSWHGLSIGGPGNNNFLNTLIQTSFIIYELQGIKPASSG